MIAFVLAAAAVCAPFADLERGLAEKYGERPIGHGHTPPGHAVWLFTNPGTGSFTVLLVRDGLGCAVAAGEPWIVVPPGEPT